MLSSRLAMQLRIPALGGCSLLLVLLGGCGAPPNGGSNGGQTDPPPGSATRVTVLFDGQGVVNQESGPGGVTLTAEPNDGWEFSRWFGADVPSAENPITVDPNLVTSITAIFEEAAVSPRDDRDGDGVADDDDNCITVENPFQLDTDLDGMGDLCDICAMDPDDDRDGDGVCADVDNCPGDANQDQLDTDGDGVGDECEGDQDSDGVLDDDDNCPDAANADQTNSDGDDFGDDCDNCPDVDNADQADGDEDGVGDDCDNCPDDENTSQSDGDNDDIGDACDPVDDTPPGNGGGTTPPADPVCGNGVRESGEVCDDGNVLPGDGCDENCQSEVPGFCGDGVLAPPGEECDDGNTTPGDGCDENCELEAGSCGDGILALPDEECDDGNTVPGDGCDENCELEAGFCGDGILAIQFEECDDGNTTAGDGCDANCMLERPQNDECADAIAVFDGDTGFNNFQATTDGPDEPATCDFGFGTTQVADDIWFCYEATCNGTVVASLCGSDYDTKLAVYDGCACPPAGQPLACSDDDCGAGALDSRLTFTAVLGQSYAIRVGGFDAGSQGTGTLALRCDSQPLCDVAAGDCFAAGGNGSPGCDTASCCDTTCAADPFCCDVTWDSTCAAEAQGLCTGSFPACSTSTGACDVGNGGGGCEDESCCNLVCAADPFCCVDTWDDICASEAAGICGLNCGTTGAPRNNACDTIAVPGVNTPVAGCSDETTCKDVCTTAPECCLQEWGQKCVCLADPSDPCCVAVCADDAFCCSTTEWDDLCDDAAADLCTP